MTDPNGPEADLQQPASPAPNATGPPEFGLRHLVPVVVGTLLAHCFLWAFGHDVSWCRFLSRGYLTPSARASFLKDLGICLLLGPLIWVIAAALARRFGRVERLSQGLALTSRAYWVLFVFALAPALWWRQFAEAAGFLIQVGTLAVCAAVLVRAVGPRAREAKGASDGRRGSDKPTWAIVVVLGVFALDRTLAGVWRFLSFNANMDDLGLYDQLLWGLLHGHGLWTTVYTMPGHSFLAEHIMPSVALLIPFYLLAATPVCLYLAQSLFIVGGGVALALIARERTRWAWFPFLAICVFALYAPLERGWVGDFHVDAMEVGLYLLAYWFFLKRRTFAYWVALLALLGCKEDVGLQVAALGFWMAVFERRRRIGAATFVVGSLWSTICILVLLPWFGAAEQNRQIANYAHLGGSAREIAMTFLLRPDVVLGHLFLHPQRVESLVKILAPFAFVGLLRPSMLILLAPSIVVTVLSGWESQYALHTHYGLVFVAPAFIGFVEGWRVLERRWEQTEGMVTRRAAWVVAISMCSLAAHIEYAKFSIDRPLKWEETYRIPDRRATVIEKIIERVPPDGRVSAQNGIGSCLTYRRWVYKFPKGLDKSDFVVIDVKTVPASERLWYRDIVRDLCLEGEFGVLKRAEGAALLGRDVRRPVYNRDFQYLMEKLGRL